jgi:hypothetical protein
MDYRLGLADPDPDREVIVLKFERAGHTTPTSGRVTARTK